MYFKFNDFINTYDILFAGQYGFRRNYSTTLALFDVVEMVKRECYNGNYIMGIFLDFSKAFDSVCHSMLMYKLWNVGFRGNIFDWIKSFLSNRRIFTYVNDTASDTTTIKYGVPQGSVLGPLFFLLFINDLYRAIPHSLLKLFADDSNVFVISNNILYLYVQGNSAVSDIVNWCECNKLHINYKKTSYMVFNNSVSTNNLISSNNLNLYLNSIPLTRTNCCKYLGLFLDNDLKFDTHVDYVVKKINS